MKNKLILASQSPRRRELLTILNVPFEVKPANVEENIIEIPDAVAAAKDKARAILRENPRCVVIGADTIVAAEGEILGKPKDSEDAKRMLRLLSGKRHSVYTGIAVLSGSGDYSGLIETKITVDRLDESEIESYIREEHVLDAAGAYKIQGSFAKFISHLEGEYSNVVGLPLNWLYRTLKREDLL
jgi:septum formation protein